MVAMMVENINRELRRTRETHRPKLDTAQRASARPLPECRRYQLVTPSNTKFFMIRGFLRERPGFAGASAFALKQGVLGGWLTLKSNTERRNAPSPRPSPTEGAGENLRPSQCVGAPCWLQVAGSTARARGVLGLRKGDKLKLELQPVLEAKSASLKSCCRVLRRMVSIHAVLKDNREQR